MQKVNVCGHRVLLDVHFDSNEIEDGPLKGFKTESDEAHKRSRAAAVTGKVVGIGDMCWKAFDGDSPDWKPWCKIGDIVYFAKFGGKFIKIDEKDFIICNDEDIQAVIEESE
jgi:co-chaperonin GroES (HSP10)